MKGTVVVSVDARMRVIEGTLPPAAVVNIELEGKTFTLPTGVARVLLDRLADSVTSAERFTRGESHRLALQRQQADREVARRALERRP